MVAQMRFIALALIKYFVDLVVELPSVKPCFRVELEQVLINKIDKLSHSRTLAPLIALQTLNCLVDLVIPLGHLPGFRHPVVGLTQFWIVKRIGTFMDGRLYNVS